MPKGKLALFGAVVIALGIIISLSVFTSNKLVLPNCYKHTFEHIMQNNFV